MTVWYLWAFSAILGGLMGSLLVSALFAARRADGDKRQNHLDHLANQIDKLKRNVGEVDERVRALELIDTKRRVQVGWLAYYQSPEDRVSSFSIFHFPAKGIISAVHENGLVLENGNFIPWSWVAWVENPRPDESKPKTPDTNAPGETVPL